MIRAQFNSTYSKSYNGLPQGYNPLGGYLSNETNIIRTKNTEVRENYVTKLLGDPIKGYLKKYPLATGRSFLNHRIIVEVIKLNFQLLREYHPIWKQQMQKPTSYWIRTRFPPAGTSSSNTG